MMTPLEGLKLDGFAGEHRFVDNQRLFATCDLKNSATNGQCSGAVSKDYLPVRAVNVVDILKLDISESDAVELQIGEDFRRSERHILNRWRLECRPLENCYLYIEVFKAQQATAVCKIYHFNGSLVFWRTEVFAKKLNGAVNVERSDHRKIAARIRNLLPRLVALAGNVGLNTIFDQLAIHFPALVLEKLPLQVAQGERMSNLVFGRQQLNVFIQVVALSILPQLAELTDNSKRCNNSSNGSHNANNCRHNSRTTNPKIGAGLSGINSDINRTAREAEDCCCQNYDDKDEQHNCETVNGKLKHSQALLLWWYGHKNLQKYFVQICANGKKGQSPHLTNNTSNLGMLKKKWGGGVTHMIGLRLKPAGMTVQ
ncbi:hypothetical protein [Maritalea porphyrae]|uniref:hypothetical protein n=1 Tax=Maritalea porphyrae TaxID=880732 RepID=UPI0022B066CE|nr:hypothetical protein [Maritalea porphyrae]MCZ4274012.1 hypothetical protein [Maritalea porphyrae]